MTDEHEHISEIEILARKWIEIDTRHKEILWNLARLYDTTTLELYETGDYQIEVALSAATMRRLLADEQYMQMEAERKQLEAQRADVTTQIERFRWELFDRLTNRIAWLPLDVLGGGEGSARIGGNN